LTDALRTRVDLAKGFSDDVEIFSHRLNESKKPDLLIESVDAFFR
jgi:hypothetical protein